MDTNTKLVRLTEDQIELLTELADEREAAIRSGEMSGFPGGNDAELVRTVETLDALKEA
jgi:hypothetical protein